MGRNGTGKTTLLRAMAQHQIKGIPENCQILHVEQEVVTCDNQLQSCAATVTTLFGAAARIPASTFFSCLLLPLPLLFVGLAVAGLSCHSP